MKTRLMTFMTGAMLLMLILLTGLQPATAKPTGEIKLVKTSWGYEVPIPISAMGKDVEWLRLLYDTLVGTTPDGDLSPKYGLADKWEMSSDALAWTFSLKKGIKFHDGVELTAKDVKFSIEQYLLPSTVSGGVPFKDHLKSIEVKDPYTLVVFCKKPTPFLASWVTDLDSPAGMIIPKDYYEKVGKDEFQKHPIGTGPYKWHSQVDKSFIKLEATDKHWRDGVPRYKFVTFLTIPEENTQLAMLKTGEADIMQINLEMSEDAQKAGLRLVSRKGQAGQVAMVPNMQWTSPAFSDIRFRKALNFAVNKEAIIKHKFRGQAAIEAWPSKPLLPCGGDPTLKPYPYDPEEARRLIKEGGYEGYEFTLVSYPRPECPDLPGLVEVIGADWKKIGLKPKIMMTDYSSWRNRWRSRKTENHIHPSVWRESLCCDSLVPRMYEKVHSKAERTVTLDPKIDKMLDDAFTSLDTNEIKKIMGEFNRYVHSLYLVVPICDLDEVTAITKRIPEWTQGSRRNDMNLNDLIAER